MFTKPGEAVVEFSQGAVQGRSFRKLGGVREFSQTRGEGRLSGEGFYANYGG